MKRSFFATQLQRLAKAGVMSGLAAALLQVPASAANLTWTVNNASFGHTSGTLSGTFDYDADTQTLGNFNLVTTVTEAGQPSGFTYVTGDTAFAITNSSLDFLTPNGTNSAFLLLDFATSLSDSGGTVNLDLAGSEESSIFSSSGYLRGFTSGTVSATGATPEPGTMALTIGSLGAVISLVRRRRS